MTKQQHKAWTDAEAWIETFREKHKDGSGCIAKLWRTYKNDEAGFYALKIRELRIVAKQINFELGEIICKRQFAKSVSEMRKSELAAACWYVFSLRSSRPHGGLSEVRPVPTSNRVVSFVDKAGLPWTTNVGYATQSQAREFFNYLMADERKETSCKLASIRKSKRCEGYEWEVKVWSINGGIYQPLLSKAMKQAESAARSVEIPVVVPELQAEPQPDPEEEHWERRVQRYQDMWDGAMINPNPTYIQFLADKIHLDPTLELVDGKVWLRRHWNELISVLIRDAATLNGCFIKGDFDSLNSSQMIQHNGRQIGTIAWINGGYQICPEPGRNLAKWYPVKDPEDGMLQLLDHAGALAF